MLDFNILYLLPNTTFNQPGSGRPTHSEIIRNIFKGYSPLNDANVSEYADHLTLSNPSNSVDDQIEMVSDPQKRPNILFILSDDFGHGDIGYNAEDIRTPNLDRLAANGLKLTNYYTLCICSASRGVILTGRYDIHNGLRGIVALRGRKGVSLNIPLISDVLHQDANYSTYCVGKWHIGKASWYQTPTHRGFDYFYGMLGGQSNYFTVCVHPPFVSNIKPTSKRPMLV